MSIIYDALKKVEHSQGNNPQAQTEKKNKFHPKVYLIYISVVCVGFATANIIFGFFSKAFKDNEHAVGKNRPQQETAAPASPLISEPPKEQAAALSEEKQVSTVTESNKPAIGPMVVNGVFFSGDEGYALINNRVVKEGDSILGATVVRISLDQVELKSGEQIIKLSTQAK